MKLLVVVLLSALVASSFALPVSKPDGLLCPICEYVMKTIDGKITANSTEHDIINIVDNVCDILPKTIEKDCKDFMQLFGPKIIDALVNKHLQPSQVCTSIGVCDAKKVVAPQGDVECVVCEFALKELDKFLTSNSTETEIVDAVEHVCNVLPGSIRKVCDAFVFDFGPKIINSLVAKHLQPNQVCSSIGACKMNRVAPVKIDAPEGVFCPICEFAMREVDKKITSNSTEHEIISIVDNVCDILPKTIEKDCKELMQLFGPKIIDNLVNKHLKPSQVCTAIGLCSSVKAVVAPKNDVECVVCEFALKELDKFLTSNSTETEIVDAVEHVCNVLPGSIRKVCDAFVFDFGPKIINALVAKHLQPHQVCSGIGACKMDRVAPVKIDAPEGIFCPICEYAMREVDKKITANSTEHDIINIVDNVCDILPKTIEKDCKELMQLFGPKIIDALVNKHLQPSQVCTAIGLCSSVKAVVAPKNDVECVVCEFALKELDKFLTSNSTETEIVDAVEHVCNVLPGSIRKICDHFVFEYGPKVINALVAKHLQPNQVCSAIGVCKSVKVAKVAAPEGALCPICEFAMREVDKKITSNSTEHDIINIVDNVCDILPKTIEKDCKELMQLFGPKIIDNLVNKHLKPSQVCTAIGLCNSMERAVPVKAVAESNGVDCPLCEFILSELDKFLTENSTETEIIDAVEHVCNVLPGSLRKACDAFVFEYGPYIINAIVNKINPKQVCTSIGMCSTTISLVTAPEDVGCVICEFALKELDKFLTSNSTETEIVDAVEHVCNVLPGSLRKVCDEFVFTYGPLVIQALVAKHLQPSQVCSEIGLCKNSKAVVAVKLNDCALCELVFTTLAQELQSNKTQHEIVDVLVKVCDDLPTVLQAACTDLLHQYGPAALSGLANDIQPKNLCTDLELCKKR